MPARTAVVKTISFLHQSNFCSQSSTRLRFVPVNLNSPGNLYLSWAVFRTCVGGDCIYNYLSIPGLYSSFSKHEQIIWAMFQSPFTYVQISRFRSRANYTYGWVLHIPINVNLGHLQFVQGLKWVAHKPTSNSWKWFGPFFHIGQQTFVCILLLFVC